MNMSREATARANHKSGYNCAQSVTVAFADALGASPARAMELAPKPRSEGGKCGAYLAALQLLRETCPEAVAAFEQRFLQENGATECGKLRRTGKPCNDLVGSAARLVEELTAGSK